MRPRLFQTRAFCFVGGSFDAVRFGDGDGGVCGRRNSGAAALWSMRDGGESRERGDKVGGCEEGSEEGSEGGTGIGEGGEAGMKTCC